MDGGAFEQFQARLRSPLETIATLVMIIMTCLRLGFPIGAPVPFKLCGHVYARPPGEVYFLVATLATSALMLVLYDTVGRYFAVLRRGAEHPTARLMPTVGCGAAGHVALYTRSSTPLLIAAFNVFSAAFFTWFLGRRISQAYVAFVGITVVQVLNLGLGVANAALPPQKRKTFYAVVKFLSVFVTDREYRDLRLEDRDWSPSEPDEAVDGCTDALCVQSGGAVFDVDDGNSLYVHGAGSFGLLNGSAWLLTRARAGKPVQVEKQDLDFRLVPLRVPYALVWYSVYQGFLEMDGYKGADEIDKCVAWLILVSAISGMCVRFIIPGPCLVIENNCKDLTGGRGKIRESEFF